MSPSFAPRPPSRFAAGALLLGMHVALVVLLLSLRSHIERPRDGIVTLLLNVLPTTPHHAAATAAAATPAKPQGRARAAPAVRPVALPPAIEAIPIAAPPAGIDGGSTATVPGPAGAASGAASAPAGRLELAIPRAFFDHPPPLTAAQEAMRDPRSNRLVLSKQEQIEIDFGEYECIAWQREPDGSIYRGPGHWQRVQTVDTNPLNGRRAQECVK